MKSPGGHNQDGQATTEYVLLMLVLVLAIFTVGKAFRDKINGLLNGRVGNFLQQRFFNEAGMHKMKIRIPK